MSADSTPLPIAEIAVIVSSLETLSDRIEAIGDTQRGTDRGDQISNELHLISSTIGQAVRRLARLDKR
jgi:hypothetical protein